jgi:fermentation-respiration switch protein FrsA (DUF1100 family)
MNKILKRILVTSVTIVALWLVACCAILILSPKLLFKTDKSKNAVFNLQPVQEFRTNKAGDSLDILWIPNDTAKITYLYFHGNVGRLPKVISDLRPFGNVCSPAYPGYSKSTGKPTTENVYETVDIAVNFLKEKHIDMKNIVVLGHSMGGSPAIYAAVHYPDLKKVITVNTFYSIKKMCEEQYVIFCLFGGSILNTSLLAPDAKAPVLVCHNPLDSLIPFAQGEMLFKLLGTQQKEFRKITGTHAVFNMNEVLK